jgi:hypothetical protein
MQWIQSNWALVAPLALSVVTNLVVFIKLGSARKFIVDFLAAASDKQFSDAEKVQAFDNFAAVVKDVYAVIKGLAPWKSKT